MRRKHYALVPTIPSSTLPKSRKRLIKKWFVVREPRLMMVQFTAGTYNTHSITDVVYLSGTKLKHCYLPNWIWVVYLDSVRCGS